ncbi:MAG: hypothetical protein MAG715_00815 [Methanonatronarchaeales archaeon]|nr:hypothetical protein [Methanonatronarchaeales archaeon]
MSEEEVLELSLAGEDEGDELSSKLAGEEEPAGGTAASGPPTGGWVITLKNPTIKIEKLVVKREE